MLHLTKDIHDICHFVVAHNKYFDIFETEIEFMNDHSVPLKIETGASIWGMKDNYEY